MNNLQIVKECSRITKFGPIFWPEILTKIIYYRYFSFWCVYQAEWVNALKFYSPTQNHIGDWLNFVTCEHSLRHLTVLRLVHAKRLRYKHYVDEQNGYATHSVPSQFPPKRSKVLPVNVTVMVTESFGVNEPLRHLTVSVTTRSLSFTSTHVLSNAKCFSF